MADNGNGANRDLLGLIERLVDNLQETNTTNTEMLKNVNTSLVRISETLPEIKEISKDLDKLGGDELVKEVRGISTKLKIWGAVISIAFTLFAVILGLTQSNIEDNIVRKTKIVVEQEFLEHILILEKQIKFIEQWTGKK